MGSSRASACWRLVPVLIVLLGLLANYWGTAAIEVALQHFPSLASVVVLPSVFFEQEGVVIEETKFFDWKASFAELVGKAAQQPYTYVEQAPDRMLVIGDVHGDLAALKTALRIAKVSDGVSWTGGKTVLVQMGDIMDRGEEDLAAEMLLFKLEAEAEEAGGKIYRMLGNHEMMNCMGTQRDAHSEAHVPFLDLTDSFSGIIERYRPYLTSQGIPAKQHARTAAFLPGGPLAAHMASHSVALVIADTLFVHAGLKPEHLEPQNCGDHADATDCLNFLNQHSHGYLTGQTSLNRTLLMSSQAPLWARHYSEWGMTSLPKDREADLDKVLQLTGTKRMVVGHSVQRQGINSANGKIWRCDTGMTASIGGVPEVLEILGGSDLFVLSSAQGGPANLTAAQRTYPGT